MKGNLPYLLAKYRIRIWIFLLILFCLVILSVVKTPKLNSDWKVVPTENFLIYYEKDSPAQKDIKMLVGLLERYFKETTQIFDINLSRKIPYYFHSRQLNISNMPVWGYATKSSIHVVYSDFQKDSSPHELRHFIHQLINPDAPYFFNEGACGLGIQIGGIDFHGRARNLCSDLSKYSLLELVRDFKKYGRLGDYLAYSFSSFLIEHYGKEKFADFYAKATMDHWQETMNKIYRLSTFQLEAKWKNFLCKE